MQAGYDIGFADSNAAAQTTGFSFMGGGKNSAGAIALVAGLVALIVGAVVWLFTRDK